MYDGKFPNVLDEELQEELLKEYIKTGDPKVKDTLILHNLRLVKSISRRYQVKNNPLREEEDLFNEGVIGLMNSLETYDPDKGSFSHHAATHIRASIGSYVRDKTKGLRVSAWVYETLYKIESFKREYSRHNNREEPTLQDISEVLDIPYKKVEYLMSIEQKVSSLDIQVSEEGEGTTLGDMLEDPESSFEDDVCSSVFVEEFIVAAADLLEEEEVKVIKLTLGLNCREFQINEVSRIIKMDDKTAKILKEKALRKIRNSEYVQNLYAEREEIRANKPNGKLHSIVSGSSDQFPYLKKSFKV